MNNIEKLAKTHCIGTYQNSEDGERFYFRLQDLEAFAKALQSSEPVFAEYLDDDEEWQKINVKDIGTYEHAMFKTRLLFTHPPASVSLEKYNKLLDALRWLVGSRDRVGWIGEVIDNLCDYDDEFVIKQVRNLGKAQQEGLQAIEKLQKG